MPERRAFLVAMGGLLGASLLARAQRSGKPARVGVIQTTLTIRRPFWQPYFAALGERGWREGTHFTLELMETGGDPARAVRLAQELVAKKVDLLLAISTASAVAARKASDRVPVVTWCGYPVEAGIAASLARPGGNVTGVANYAGLEVWGKFIDLLRDLRPGMSELGVLWDYVPPAFPDGPIALAFLRETAGRLGLRSRIWTIAEPQHLDDALVEIDQGRADALLLTNGGGIHNRREQASRIGEVIARRRLPTITDIAGTLLDEVGGLLAYSPNVPEILGRLASFTDRILRGANPAVLPFELPSRYELTVNMRSARSLGLGVPQSLLLHASKVIE